MKKPRDQAQRWRAFKNIARMIKNPAAFGFWKLGNFRENNRIRLIWVVLVFHLYSSFMLTLQVKTIKEAAIEKWFFVNGQVSKMTAGPRIDR